MVSTSERIITLQWLTQKELKEKAEEIAAFIGTLDEKHRKAALVILIDEAGVESLVKMRSLLSENRELLQKILEENSKYADDDTDQNDDGGFFPALEIFSDENDPGTAAILGDTDSTRYEKNDVIQGLKLREMALRLGVITEDALGPLDWLPFALRRTRLQRALSGDPKDEVLDEQSHGAKRKLLKELVAKEVWKTGGRIQKPSTWDRKSDTQGPQNDSE